jgi:hypothetical protein
MVAKARKESCMGVSWAALEVQLRQEHSKCGNDHGKAGHFDEVLDNWVGVLFVDSMWRLNLLIGG